MDASRDILLLTERIPVEDLRRLLQATYVDMVKFVADVERGCIAIGGQMHADAEAALLEDGSVQPSLWGANYYPGRGPDEFLEFTSLINIRPAQSNPSMEIADEDIRARVAELARQLIGSGEAI